MTCSVITMIVNNCLLLMCIMMMMCKVMVIEKSVVWLSVMFIVYSNVDIISSFQTQSQSINWTFEF